MLPDTAPHAQRQDGASMQTASAATPQIVSHHIPIFLYFILRIPHWTKAAGCHAKRTTLSPHPPAAQRDM